MNGSAQPYVRHSHLDTAVASARSPRHFPSAVSGTLGEKSRLTRLSQLSSDFENFAASLRR
jgi:hypothetical protein